MSGEYFPQAKASRFYDPIEKFLLKKKAKLGAPWRAVKWCTFYAGIAGLMAAGLGETSEPIILAAISSSIFFGAFGAQWRRNVLRRNAHIEFNQKKEFSPEVKQEFTLGCEAANSYLLTAISFLPFFNCKDPTAFQAGYSYMQAANEAVLSDNQTEADTINNSIKAILKSKHS